MADAEARHRHGDGVRVGEAMAGPIGAAWPAELRLEIDEHGAGEVVGLRGGPARAPVQVPGDAGEDDHVALGRQLGRVDHRREHAARPTKRRLPLLVSGSRAARG